MSQLQTSALISLCQDEVPGWKQVPNTDLEVQVLRGGLTNKLYTVAFSPSLQDSSGNNDMPPILKVVVRLFGEGLDTLICDNIAQLRAIENCLADRGYGAHILHQFDGGRIEIFLSGRTLTCDDLQDADNSLSIAKILASLHSEDLTHLYPSNPVPSLIYLTRRWLDIITDTFQKGIPTSKQKDPRTRKEENQLWLKMANIKWGMELNWLLKHLAQFNSPIVFSHNDLQEGNLICGERMHLIDFEYSGYNYRGFDFGNHFCEVFLDYGYSSWPYFYIHRDRFPNQLYRSHFIRHYLENVRKDKPIHEEDIIACDREAVNFMMASHMLWLLWGMIQSTISSIEFGYLQYAADRFALYSTLKKSILEDQTGEYTNVLRCVHMTALNKTAAHLNSSL